MRNRGSIVSAIDKADILVDTAPGASLRTNIGLLWSMSQLSVSTVLTVNQLLKIAVDNSAIWSRFVSENIICLAWTVYRTSVTCQILVTSINCEMPQQCNSAGGRQRPQRCWDYPRCSTLTKNCPGGLLVAPINAPLLLNQRQRIID